MLNIFFRRIMWFTQLFSGSRTVEREILERLPHSITIEFSLEFDDDDNPIIFINAPEFPGLVSQSSPNIKEAIDTAIDAILTYFDVPRECANLIEYTTSETNEQLLELNEEKSRVLKSFNLSHA